MTLPNLKAIQEILDQVSFPADKSEIIRKILEDSRDKELLETFEKLPDRHYTSKEDALQSLKVSAGGEMFG